MVKPTIEFTPVTEVTMTPPAVAGGASTRTLSHDADTGDWTVVLYHPPGQKWGGEGGEASQAVHKYWEEVLILKGRIFDITLQKWFGPGDYCCRPPGMLHGPWIADTEVGCEEVAWLRYPRVDEAVAK